MVESNQLSNWVSRSFASMKAVVLGSYWDAVFRGLGF